MQKSKHQNKEALTSSHIQLSLRKMGPGLPWLYRARSFLFIISKGSEAKDRLGRVKHAFREPDQIVGSRASWRKDAKGRLVF